MGGGYTGICYSSNERFEVPQTKNTLQEVCLPWNWTLLNLFNLVFYLAVFTTYFLDLPLLFYIIQFFFWRFSYSFLVGYMLKKQSESEAITRLVMRILSGNGWIALILRLLLLPSTYSSNELERKAPAPFHSWKLFRKVVDLILDCDFFSYVVLAFKILNVFVNYRRDFSDKFLVSNDVLFWLGVAICVVSALSKIDAHVRIGDYSWYYGDFFFRSERELIFNGVFSMFPHPMYTAGYIWYYGSVCITRSLLLFYISIVAHAMQMFFLKYVEDPHILKIYGDDISGEEIDKKKKLYDKETGYFGMDLIIMKNFCIFRSSDVSLVLLVLYNVILLLFNIPLSFYYYHAIFWRLFHSGFLGILLYLQSNYGIVTRYYERQGRSNAKRSAFEDWKRLYNISLTMTSVSFICCTFKFAAIPEIFPLYQFLGFRNLIGVLLCAIGLYSFVSTRDALGDFGFFYGDFFIDEITSHPTYNGLYRYLNNPDLIAGFSGFYGLAMLASSLPILVLALFSQVSHYTFLRFVEIPHMKSVYGDALRRRAGIQDGLGEIATEFKDKIRIPLSPRSPKKGE